MKQTAPLLLVDGNNLLYRAAFGFPTRIYNRRKEDVTTVFAFFALLRIAFREVGFPLAPIVCFDGAHSLDKRRQMFDSYKANRTDNRLNPYADLPTIIESLAQLSLPVVVEDSLEADDVIAHFIFKQNYEHSFVMSSDKDFYQLVDDQTLILNMMRKNNERIITGDDIFTKFGVLPNQWTIFRALMGDPSDFIKGIPGVGPKTARILAQLSDGELQEVLLKRYNTRWEEFERIVQLIMLDGSAVELTGSYELRTLQDFAPPARVLDQLGMWG